MMMNMMMMRIGLGYIRGYWSQRTDKRLGDPLPKVDL